MSGWINSFLDGLYAKFANIPFQLDFGNFAVGCGTAFVAFASYQAVRRSGHQRIGEFRKEWIENLRVHLAEIMALNASRLQIERDHGEILDLSPTRVLYPNADDLKKKWERAYYLVSYVQLMLNPAEPAHQQLEKIMFEIVESGPTGERLNRLVAQSRLVLKTEWDRVKN